MESESLFTTELLNRSVVFHPIGVGTLIGIGVIVLLLFASAMISGSEVAFFSISPAEIEELKRKKGNAAKILLKFLNMPERVLATILVANNFVNVGIVILMAWITNSIVDFSAAPILGFIIQVVVITALLLLVGEIIPKVYANQRALKFALRMSRTLNILERIFRPLNTVLIFCSSTINKRFKNTNSELSLDDISDALELTSDEEIKQDKEILEGIIKFGNKCVSDIIKARVDVVALEINETFDDVLKIIKESGYSRIPVYVKTFDNVKGILYIKDLLTYIDQPASFEWQTLIKPPFYVPQTKKIDDLLEEFQKTKVHLAIVVDEYGGTAGVVTLEDVLEEIVGEISDEFDEEEQFFSKIDDQTYIFDGKIMLNDFYKVIDSSGEDFDIIRGDADTLAGLILELKGEIPRQSEVIEFANYKFEIIAADIRRVKEIKMTIK